MGEHEETVRAVTSTVWSIVLGVELAPLPDEPIPSGCDDDDGVASLVEISGAWQGVVALQCSAEVARRAAAVLLGIELETVGPDDCRDAVAELINIIGGNVKALLEQPSHLSLPTVLIGPERDVRVPPVGVGDRVWFDWEGLSLSVTVVDGRVDVAASAS